ncbi:flagellar basal-body MS-ring/collar protein FliF [Ferriphaselus sp. R-1]|uniref:flagellar basal-body MS-ring/collar protein FliF n=1 Tax=Ferriphaselus sp. R-1 TaxID=1485544 RepID=UPI00055654BF|nr:flagellar basal-body MS-ring/collar protein FliF [Ferriphaselus sp. R-1]
MADTDITTRSGSPLTQALDRLSGSQKIGLMVAIAAIIAIVIGSVMWGQTPDYRVLYSNLSDRDGGAIIESLQQMNVPYKFTEGGGAVLVPANLVHETRLKLASQGLPKGGNVGFELMENQKFGTSQFLEQVNYQRALEGELARSVQTLASVQSARVHLAIPKPSVFVKDQQKPSASVILSLNAGRTLDAGQVSAIVHLISSSVPEMSAKSVTLVDQNGTLLSAMREGGTEVLDASQLKYLRQIEQDYVKRIQDIIIPLVGANNVRAQVTADLDFSQSEQTAESYGPNQPPNQAAVRSQQSTESVNNGAGGPAGVPGALSNQPPVPATAPIVNPASSVTSSAATSSTHKEATTNFEVDRTIRHTKLPVGSIKRMSVAVVVNHRTVLDKKGTPSSKPLSDEEKAQITALVKEAMGYDEKRGDSLEVINSAFTDDKEVLPDVPLWKQPGMVDLAKELLKYGLIAGVMLALIFMVIRPAFKNLAPPPPQEPGEESGESAAEGATHQSGHDDAIAGAGADAASGGLNRSAPSYENHVQAVKQLAQQDPKIVATVVKEWVNGNE